MDKQRGGAFRVNGYLAIALVALALAVIEMIALRHYIYENHILRLVVYSVLDQCNNPATQGTAFHL